jgi:hypothetical protein
MAKLRLWDCVCQELRLGSLCFNSSLSALDISHVMFCIYTSFIACLCLSVCIYFFYLLSVFCRLSPSSSCVFSRLCNFPFVPLSFSHSFLLFLCPADNFQFISRFILFILCFFLLHYLVFLSFFPSFFIFLSEN